MRRDKVTSQEKAFRKKRIAELEARYRELFDMLLEDPSNEELSRRVRHLEIDIVRLTGEKILDY
jgi:hypothetical protein